MFANTYFLGQKHSGGILDCLECLHHWAGGRGGNGGFEGREWWGHSVGCVGFSGVGLLVCSYLDLEGFEISNCLAESVGWVGR